MKTRIPYIFLICLLIASCSSNDMPDLPDIKDDIAQETDKTLQPEADVVYADSEGKDFGVRLKTNVDGKINVDFRFDGQSEWIEFIETVEDFSNPWIPGDILHFTSPQYYLHFRTKENTGLGRICRVTVSAEGTDLTSQFVIIQQPRLFDEEETIAIHNAGTLDVLVGTDKDNIRRVRKLTLTGEMNGLDWSALRTFFYKGIAMDPSPDAYPVDLDLSAVLSVRGAHTYYSALGYEPKESEYYVYEDHEIPDKALERCINLTGIRLPEKTTKINALALANTNLHSVDIPVGVKEIGHGAFQACANLTEINIPDNSNLQKLGSAVFQGCGTLEHLNLPASLTEMEYNSLIFSVKEMKVHWPTPPELRVTPIVKDGSVLYVPKGAASLYREALGWKRFPSILEFE